MCVCLCVSVFLCYCLLLLDMNEIRSLTVYKDLYFTFFFSEYICIGTHIHI